jgi:hypothetical protein
MSAKRARKLKASEEDAVGQPFACDCQLPNSRSAQGDSSAVEMDAAEAGKIKPKRKRRQKKSTDATQS